MQVSRACRYLFRLRKRESAWQHEGKKKDGGMHAAGGRDPMPAPVEFAAPDLGARLEQLSQFELDRLPFGVILIDRDGIVQFYSETEARLSGYGALPLGQNLFAVSSCMASDEFRGRIERAAAQGPVDLAFAFNGDFNDPARALQVRVLSARQGGVWICIAREAAGMAAPSSD